MDLEDISASKVLEGVSCRDVFGLGGCPPPPILGSYLLSCRDLDRGSCRKNSLAGLWEDGRILRARRILQMLALEVP